MHEIISKEFEEQEVPKTRFKKFIIISGRVHPGESNGSLMMQGFLKFIISDEKEAQELRKRIIFKVIPMSNPDGVIIGNYRTSMAGSDLNR